MGWSVEVCLPQKYGISPGDEEIYDGFKGILDDRIANKAIEMNDDQDKSFTAIADMIEEELLIEEE